MDLWYLLIGVGVVMVLVGAPMAVALLLTGINCGGPMVPPPPPEVLEKMDAK